MIRLLPLLLLLNMVAPAQLYTRHGTALWHNLEKQPTLAGLGPALLPLLLSLDVAAPAHRRSSAGGAAVSAR